jgi:hypothetical protein
MMNEPGTTSDGSGPTPTSGGSVSTTATPTTIDVEQLAEKVYQLMQADLRLARARRGKISRQR